MTNKTSEIVVADTGPLITLAFADQLDLLLKTDAHLVILDVVYLEATSSNTFDAERIKQFVSTNNIDIVETDRGKEIAKTGIRKRHDGERAIQDYLFEFADIADQQNNDDYSTLIFEDHKLKSTSFVLPDNVYLLTTMSLLLLLQKRSVIPSARAVVDAANAAGRACSEKEFDSPPKRDPSVKPF